MKPRPPKKTETVEVRLPHEVKSALMRKARAEGRSASEVLREFIGLYLAEQPKEARSMFSPVWKPAAAAGVAAVAILASALSPGPVSAAPDLRAAFAEFDRNGDKAITLDEFLKRSPDTLYVMKREGPGPKPGAEPSVIPISRELPAPPPSSTAPPQEMLRGEFAKHDRDGDGSVTFAEFEAHHVGMMRAGFTAVDRDRDGTIDRSEFEAVVKAAPAGPAPARFEDVDANRDGRISEEEFFA